MNQIAIPLGRPLGILIRNALALPNGNVADECVVYAMRRVHELACGRFVETSIGPIQIAPPVAPDLAGVRLHAATRRELLSLVERIIASPSDPRCLAERMPQTQTDAAISIDNTTEKMMKDLTIHITPHGLKLSTRLREFVCRKISGISRFCDDLLSAEVVLRGPSGAPHLFSVSARLALPGRDVQANAAHANVYGAINKLVARLGRLSRKRKTRLTRTPRELEKKRTKQLPDQSSLLYAL